MKKISITLEIPNSAKQAIPSIMKDLGIAGTEYSTKPLERIMLWGKALDVVDKVISRLKNKGFNVKKLSKNKKEVIMPGFDGTGPFGRGPGTGMGRGRCFNCPQCGFEIRPRMEDTGEMEDTTGGMEDTNGWHGIRPQFLSPRRSDEDEEIENEETEKEAQDTTFPVLLKHNRVRVPELKGREIGTVEKVYLDGSLDVLFPSDGETVFIDFKGKNSVQKVGLNVGDRLSGGFKIKTLHENKEIGIYAATIQYKNGTEETVVLENVEQI